MGIGIGTALCIARTLMLLSTRSTERKLQTYWGSIDIMEAGGMNLRPTGGRTPNTQGSHEDDDGDTTQNSLTSSARSTTLCRTVVQLTSCPLGPHLSSFTEVGL